MLTKKSLSNLFSPKQYLLLNRLYSWLSGNLSLLFLKGSGYYCLVCGHSFRKFFSAGYKHDILQEKNIVGGGYRKNAVCPYCQSMDRERLVYLFLQSNNLVQKNMRVLHVAPEKNLQKLLLQKGVDYLAADLNSPMASIKMDIQQITFPAGHFDAIICNHVLEHVPDDGQAMRELYRVLKPGGWAVLQVPFSAVMQQTFEDPSVTTAAEREKVFGQSDHARIYGLDYPDRLRTAGFIVTAEKQDPATAEKYALNPEEPVFFCRKNP